nr:serine--tRNA ligase [Bacteroidota bacterium]
MLQINYIRENQEEVVQRLKIKNFNAAEIVTGIIALDEQRRSTQTKLDVTFAEANKLAKSIGQLFKEGKHEEANRMKAQTVGLKKSSKLLGEELE